MEYIYEIWTVIFAVFWIVFFVFRKDLRRKIIFSSIFAGILGLSEPLFIPSFWNPQFNSIALIPGKLYLCSLLWCFFVGGFVAVFYQVLKKKKLFKTKAHPLLVFSAPIIFLAKFIFGLDTMHWCLISMLAGAFIILLFLNKEHQKAVFFNAIFVTVIYFIVILILWYTLPALSQSYMFDKYIGFNPLGIPIEEPLFAFSFALYWCPLYDIIHSYKQRRKTTRK
ncbi:hypothetical protein KY336_00165 [Candidatus Woesearchaeota archaeon]|nr:hypothetical protein [Candidatus Woesearchaeota archaeon]